MRTESTKAPDQKLRRWDYLNEVGREEHTGSEFLDVPRRGFERSPLKPFTERDRHPLDRKYFCGFDPYGKSLAECVTHWRDCPSDGCTGVLEFHLALVDYFRSRG